MAMRIFFICLALVSILVHAEPTCAQDIDLFKDKVVSAPPANVLLIVDNSGSMQVCPGTNNSSTRQCDYFTKAKILRDAFLSVVGGFADEMNIGLMTYVLDTVGGDVAGGKILAPVGSSAELLQEKLLYMTGVSADIDTDSLASAEMRQIVEDIRASLDPNDNSYNRDFKELPSANSPDTSRPDYLYFDSKYNSAFNFYPFRGGGSDIGSPLGEVTAEAGLYFAGQDGAFQDFWPAEHHYNNSDSAFYAANAYNSPILYECQKNYVVVLTDGYSVDDFDMVGSNANGWPENAFVMNRNKDMLFDDYNPLLVDRTDAGIPGDSWDDVAAHLYNKQNIETVVITFDINPDTDQGGKSQEFYKTHYQDALALMKTVSLEGNGGLPGNYFDIYLNAPNEDNFNNYEEYYQALQAFNAELVARLSSVLSSILEIIVSETNATYAIPSVPRNPDNQVDAGDKTYFSFFRPTQDGRWLGNLKAYGLSSSGVLMDSRSTLADPLPATNMSGLIKSTARSYWDTDGIDDGLEVHRGGVGEVLAQRMSDGIEPRKIYTYTDIDAVNYLSLGTSALSLLEVQNQFVPTTNAVLNSLLTDIYSSATPPVIIDPDALVNNVLAGTTYTDEHGTDFDWYLGDLVHSSPLVARFARDCDGDGSAADEYIFAGANDGMLHTFCAANGKEEWAFIPPSQLSRLDQLGNGQHHYFVDGSPVMVDVKIPDDPVATQKLLFFGEGRGGSRYVALDFTTADNPAAPRWRYQVTEQLLQNEGFAQPGFNYNAAQLGQAWATPQYTRVRDVDDTTSVETNPEVFLLAGGYDPRYETESFPASVPQSPETWGRAIYTVAAQDGSVVGLNLNGGNWSAMQHSIVDVTGFDAADRGYMDRVYAGDLGGNLFAATYNADSDLWEKLHLLSLPDTIELRDSLGDPVLDLSGNPVTADRGLKIMTRPEITLETDGECVYFGTGDREHPLSEAVTDALYVVCHDWQRQIDSNTGLPKTDQNDLPLYEPVSPSGLVDVTDNLIQDSAVEAERDAVTASLGSSSGWYLRMENTGEKIVSTPKIIDGKLFFTTFAPALTGAQNLDPCKANFDLGVSRLYALDYRTGEAVFELDDSAGLTKDDRSVVIGNSIPYEPILSTFGTKTTLLYGSGGKLIPKDISLQNLLRRYFWRQIK